MGLHQRRAAGPGPGRADGHAGASSLARHDHPPDVLAMITEPMAQIYRIVPIEFRRQHADDRHVRPAEAARFTTSCGRSSATTSASWWPPSATMLKALRTLLRREQRERREHRRRHGGRRRAGAQPPRRSDTDGPIDLTERRGPGRQRPGAQAAEHGAAAGHQGPRQRLALRAVRGRVQASASRPTACCTKWCRRRGTWRSPSPPASRSWPISTSPSGGCRRTAASS